MKKKIYLIAFLFVGSSAIAQETTPSNWTSLYLGVQTGNGSMDFRDLRPSNPPHTYEYSYKQKESFNGGHFGYQHDFGKIVLGAELNKDVINVSFDVPNLNGIDGKFTRDSSLLTAGYDGGKTLTYFGFGSTKIKNPDFVSASSHSGKLLAFGISYLLSEQFILGLRYETTKYDSFDRFKTNALPAPSKLDQDSFQVRISYKF